MKNIIKFSENIFSESDTGKKMLLENKNAIVTGGSQSIGAAASLGLPVVKKAVEELGAFNVTINAVPSNLIETTMLKKSAARDKIIDLAMNEIVLKKVGQPEDLAYLVSFIASDKAKHITSEVIKVDGGQYI